MARVVAAATEFTFIVEHAHNVSLFRDIGISHLKKEGGYFMAIFIPATCPCLYKIEAQFVAERVNFRR
jgi:hypothetical protein